MSEHTVLVIDDSPTILKVVQLVLAKAGYRVETAADGEAGLEVARKVKPDLILLDFVMPKMNGYQVCRELAQDRDLKDVAVVLMSAKGDQVGERFVKVMGIVDYITKPFSPEAIVAVVQHSIAKYGKVPASEHTRPLLRTSADELDRSRTDAEAAAAAERARAQVMADVRARLSALFAAPIAEHLALAAAARGPEDDSGPNPEAIAELIRSALDDTALDQMVEHIEPLVGGSGGGPSLRGDLRVVPLAEVLQLLDQQRQSGVVYVSRGDATVEISFKEGRVELATATGVPEELLLGRFILAADMMSDEDLESFLDSRAPGSRLMGQQLVKLGYLSPDQLAQALSDQTRGLVFECLRWSFGSFRFRRTADLPETAAEAALALAVEGILMEGFRRVDEWHLIEREVSDFDQVYLRNEDAVAQMGRGRLTREEQAVLELVNGKHNVKDIVRSSKMGSFEVSKMLFRLLSIKLIRPRVQPVAV